MNNNKTYYAYVAMDQVASFEEQLEERKDKIKSIRRGRPSYSDEGTLFMPYLIDAEEGIINRKWELYKNEKES